MIEKKPDSFSDIVDRAMGELRSSPVPPELPPELLDALLQAAKEGTGAVQLRSRSIRAGRDHSSHVSYALPNQLEVDYAFFSFPHCGGGRFCFRRRRSRLLVPRRRRRRRPSPSSSSRSSMQRPSSSR